MKDCFILDHRTWSPSILGTLYFALVQDVRRECKQHHFLCIIENSMMLWTLNSVGQWPKNLGWGGFILIIKILWSNRFTAIVAYNYQMMAKVAYIYHQSLMQVDNVLMSLYLRSWLTCLFITLNLIFAFFHCVLKSTSFVSNFAFRLLTNLTYKALESFISYYNRCQKELDYRKLAYMMNHFKLRFVSRDKESGSQNKWYHGFVDRIHAIVIVYKEV